MLAGVRADLGAPSIVIHNAVGGAFGNFLAIEPDVLNKNFQINTMALLHLAQATAPYMIDQFSPKGRMRTLKVQADLAW